MMKRIGLSLFLLFSSIGLTVGQVQPLDVCTVPSTYTFDSQVTWYFNLGNNPAVTAGENLYFYSWTPSPIPTGRVLMTYVKEKLWKLTFTPTILFNKTLSELNAAGNGAFWSHIQNQPGTNVTGTIPFAQKELLRLGNVCQCIGEKSTTDNTFFVNFGSASVANPDPNNFYWTNIGSINTLTNLIDTLGVHRYDVKATGSFIANNNSDFTSPDPLILGNLAQPNATTSYFYLTTGIGEVTFSCLDSTRLYKFSVFGSRNINAVRSSKYTLNGKNSQSGILQTSGAGIASNTSLFTNDDEFFVGEVYPNVNGIITLKTEIESGGFAYLNMLKITEVVNPLVVPAVSIAINSSSLSTSGPSQLSIDYLPINTTENAVTWSVNDPTIAIIDAQGNLKPKKAGTITVTAINAFNNTLVSTLTVTYSNLVTSLYLTGTSTEVSSQNAIDALPLRRIYDKDSTVTNEFEIFTSFLNTGTFHLITANDGSGQIIGGNNSSNLIFGMGNDIVPSTSGTVLLKINLNTNTYDIIPVAGWKVVSNIIPKESNQTGWWGGDDTLDVYEGNGVWSSTINFSSLTTADNVPRLYFEGIGLNRTLKQIDNSKNKLISTEDAIAFGLSALDVYLFNGEYKVLIDLNACTFDFVKNCLSNDPQKYIFLGSSVVKGYGATIATANTQYYNGYAYQYNEILKNRFSKGIGDNWNYANVGIGGNTTTKVLNRLSRDVYTQCGKYVFVGLSLANEGIFTGGQTIFDQFETNLKAIIDSLKNHQLVPIIIGNYGNNGYTTVEHNYVKNMNILIHQWDVPSVNVLGAINDGNGRFVNGYYLDGGHPNTLGYTEFSYAIVPSLLDALAANKPFPLYTNTTHYSMGKNTSEGIVSIKPEETVHAFTTSFDLKTTGYGIIGSLITDINRPHFHIDALGKLDYIIGNDTVHTNKVINNGQWHTITFSHYYAKGESKLYIDGVLEATLPGSMQLQNLVLCDENNSPTTIDYRNWFFYRSGMNAEEIAELYSGKMLKSSLEIYAPLDGSNVLGSDVLVNLAQSENTLTKFIVNNNLGNEESVHKIALYPNPVTEKLFVSGIDEFSQQAFQIIDGKGVVKVEGKLGPNDYVDIEKLNNGIYFFKIKNVTIKFIVK